MKTQTSIFDEYLRAPSLFKNKDALSTSYVPDTLPHRDREIRFLAREMSSAFKNQVPSNIMIYGKTGSGKTAVVRYVGKEIIKKRNNIRKEILGKCIVETVSKLHKKINTKRLDKLDFWLDNNCKSHDDYSILDYIKNGVGYESITGLVYKDVPIANVNFIYINCRHVDTEYRVLTNIANHFAEKWMETIPFTGLHVDEVYRRLKQLLDRDGGVTIVALDEIDRLVYKTGDDVLYDLTRINYDLKKAKVSIIGISNDLNLTQFLESRVLSSLGAKETVFPPYDTYELIDILRERAKLAFEDGVIDEGVIELCAAFAAAEHGDARRAIDLLRVSAEVAEQRNADMIIQDHVRMARTKIEIDKVGEVIATLPMQSKIIMLAVIDLRVKGRKRITTGDVYARYKELCGISGLLPLGQRRVTDILSELNMLGLLNARIVSFGRGGGRTKVVDLTMSVNQMIETFKQDDALSKYLHLLNKRYEKRSGYF